MLRRPMACKTMRAVLTVDTDDVTVELTAAGALPEGARLTVDVAVNDEGKTAMEKALEEGYGLYRIYRLGLVDEAGRSAHAF